MIFIGNNEYPIYLGDSEIPAIYCGEELIYPVNLGTLTGITIEDLTWVTDIPSSGGIATEENCSYKVVGRYDSGKSRSVTSKATVTGSLVVPATTAETREAVGTLELTATYSGFTASGSVTAYQGIDYSKQYLTVEALENGSFRINMSGINYSLNGGNWQTSTSNMVLSISTGDKIRFKGGNTNKKAAFAEYNKTKVKIYGNIMSLLYGDDFEDKTSITIASAFTECFIRSSGITDVSNVVLPATTLSTQCYRGLFGDLPITSVPANFLPATSLATYCYRSMFQNCTGLLRAPDLPAPTLVQQCYYNMFGGCTNLNYIKCLATSISASNSHTQWVINVQTNSGTFVKSPNITTNTWGRGSNGIPNNWAVEDNT